MDMYGSKDDGTGNSTMDSTISEILHNAERRLANFDKARFKRHFAIVRTNRQIHLEALSVFYAEAILHIQPGDIFCLVEKPSSLKFGRPNPCAWKYNPLKGFGKKDKDGVVVYDTPHIGGDIKPHIFSKFQKIPFRGNFDDEHTGGMELWIDDTTHVINFDDAKEFKSRLRTTSLFKDLVKILRNSPRITLLQIMLEVEIIANSDILMADTMLEEDDEDEELDSDVNKIMDIANQKATELFVDSDIMDPLQELKNVVTCDIRFDFGHLTGDQAYHPPAKYIKKLRDMKVKIESNFSTDP